MRTTTTLNNGQRLQYVDHGGDGPVVVLLHGFLMDADMFALQVAALGGGFRLVAVNERGHGATPADAPFDYWDVARDVLALLDELGAARAAVVGTSQGGFIGLRMALLAPARVSAVAVLGTSAAAEDPDVAASYRQLAETWMAEGPVDAVLDTIAKTCLGDMDATDCKSKWRTVPGDRFARLLETLVDRDAVLDRLSKLSCPVLVLHGTADAAYPLARAAEVVEGGPRAEPLVVIEGGAHFLSLTNADDVNPHLQEFLNAHVG